MSEDLPEADFFDPIEFHWTSEQAEIRRIAREFLASGESDETNATTNLHNTVTFDTDPHGPACDPSEWEAG